MSLLNLANHSSEIFSIHNTVLFLKVFLVDDTSLQSNFLCSFVVISTNHSHIDMSFLLDGIDYTLDIISQWIFESKSSKESKLNISIIESLLEFFSSLLELSVPLFLVHFEVSKRDHSQWFGGHGVNFSSDFFGQVWAQLNNSTSALDACAHLKNDFRSSLEVHSNSSFFRWVLHNSC